MKETWVDIKGFEKRYQISSRGRIRSLDRIVKNYPNGTRFMKGKILKPMIMNTGYPYVQALIDGVRKNLMIHRLVALAFIPNLQNKPHLNHKDGNKENPSIGNLEWCTHQENMHHAFRTGLVPYPPIGKGDACPSSKLTEQKVKYIKRRIAKGESDREIAIDYGVQHGTIGHIRYRKTWIHVSI